MKTPLKQLQILGQSIWLDYIRRDLINSGDLKLLIENEGLRGLTSNPSIFEKAIVECGDYHEDVRKLALAGKTPYEIYEALIIDDIQRAADAFLPLYRKTNCEEGYVSLEVNPHLAHDAEGTLKESRRLWLLLNRPNILIKIPATEESLVAIQQLISEGISVNVTLLFGLSRYKQVIEAYLSGLELRLENHLPIDHVASVASFFISRIDTLIDPMLDLIMEKGGSKGELANNIHGQTAIACAKVAYQIYQDIVNGDRFKRLSTEGTLGQKLLWASTSSKNPNYSDIKYVEALVGSNTINTIPLETLHAYHDHGEPKSELELNVTESHWVLSQFPELGISLDSCIRQLEFEGVEKFKNPFDKLISALEQRSHVVLQSSHK